MIIKFNCTEVQLYQKNLLPNLKRIIKSLLDLMKFYQQPLIRQKHCNLLQMRYSHLQFLKT